MQTLLGIQYLRAVAAILVLVFHACEHEYIDFKTGEAGVDIFFIISGFVMWFTTFDRSITPSQFMSRRIRRLVPLYWAVTFVTLACAAAKPAFFYGVVLGVPQLLQSLLFIPYYSSDTHTWPIVLQGWTLNIEMFFYLVFAVAIAFPPMTRLVVPTIILSALALAGALFPQANAIVSIWTNPLLMELAAGLWHGFACTSGWLKHRRFGIALMVCSSLVFVALQCVHYTPDGWRFMVFGVPAFLLVAGMLMVERDGGIRTLPAWLFLGDASYSLYLWHGVAIVVCGAVTLRFGLQGLGAAFILTISSVVLSALGYIMVERPLTRFFSRRK